MNQFLYSFNINDKSISGRRSEVSKLFLKSYLRSLISKKQSSLFLELEIHSDLNDFIKGHYL